MPEPLRRPHKHPALSQLMICVGGTCAGPKAERSPKQAMLAAWKQDYLWRTCHVSFSDCLGPCEFGGNALVMTAQDSTWLGELDETTYPLLTDWVKACLAAGQPLPLPEPLAARRYERFAEPSTIALTRKTP